MKFSEYRDKVHACWLGKNIGGTLGAPFEGWRGVFDITYYTHNLEKGVLPNDDLDLQMIWLFAAEQYGRNVNAAILGEYWLTHVPCDWSEYGAGKTNLRAGLLPPVSGAFRNPYSESNGAFIRSEVWACLMPGAPEEAVKYAFEDACVDHTGDGVYGEIFCAAVESAAFAESDVKKLIEIEIGLSYIPDDCKLAQCIRLVEECKEQGLDWREARKKLLCFAPSYFGLRHIYDANTPELNPEPDIPDGEIGHDAATNVAISVIGLLYGEGDFSDSLCIAASCGEDTDCTAGFIGALMGILLGTKGIDPKWIDPIGDSIKTITLDRTKPGFSNTVTHLTERVVRLMPTFLPDRCEYPEGDEPELRIKDLTPCMLPMKTGLFTYTDKRLFLHADKLSVRAEGTMFKAMLTFDDAVYTEGKEIPLRLTLWTKSWQPYWIRLKWYLPEGWKASTGTEGWVYADHVSGKSRLTETDLVLYPEQTDAGRAEILLELSAQGRPGRVYLPLTFFRG